MRYVLVVPAGDEWAVQIEGYLRPTRVLRTRDEAIALAQRMAARRGTDVAVLNPDGATWHVLAYGDYPFPEDDTEVAAQPAGAAS